MERRDQIPDEYGLQRGTVRRLGCFGDMDEAEGHVSCSSPREVSKKGPGQLYRQKIDEKVGLAEI